ncbi:site-specific integrase [uncultured Alistipes sp.]|uniref:site-specific integrase n=1 Tax=uncultured Alistipes sp. TaxID=538949 RepID=UPI0025E0D552|nr:site-specific integrase [uncultured Alistipes sp.]
MARIKKPAKVKEPVKIRMRTLADGSKSLYLDIYRHGKRTYEPLKLYLIPERSAADRKQNATTMLAANKVKSQRIIELTTGEVGIKNTYKKVYLLDWMKTYMEAQAKRGKKDGRLIMTTIKILKMYAGERMLLSNVDKDFCLGYLRFLQTDYNPQGRKPSNFTLRNYYSMLNCALNAAVREDLLRENPFNKIDKRDKIKEPESKREYLTIGEVKQLMNTPYPKESLTDIKNAYLFSCFCGLRISDIMALQWKNVVCDRGAYSLEIVMQKTKDPIYVPLSEQAMKWMPERGDKAAEDKVFVIPRVEYVNPGLAKWAEQAGLKKHVTFHTARHTFATMMLTLGADLYTVSKLLGHSDVKVTQVYAKIVNQKKNDAVNLVNSVFG